MRLLAALCLFLSAFVTCQLRGEGLTLRRASVGQKVKAFAVKDIRFVARQLSDFSEAKAFVLLFLDKDCPVAAKYVPRVEALWKTYRPQGVVFLGIDSSPSDSLVELAAYALEKKLSFPVYKDFDQSALRVLGVKRVPTALVIDKKFILRYRGKVDDQFRVSGASPKKGREYLDEAIRAVLEGQSPAVEETTVDGCLVSKIPPSSVAKATYSEHVLPLFQKRCQACHRPNQAAPFSLLTYADAADHAEMILEVVTERRMPPSYHDLRYGAFADHLALTRQEIDTVRTWVESGTPRGDPKLAPAAIDWPDGEWDIDEPDLVLSAAKPVKIPATGYIPYEYVTMDYQFEHDVWINQIQILPGNRRVVHHANLLVRHPQNLFGDRFITGHVPGGDVTKYGPNAGIMIRKGSKVRLQIHYTTTGKPETDLTRVGFVFAKETVKRQVRILFMINKFFAIPPHDPHFEVSCDGATGSSIVGLGLFIHMHLRGKDMTFFATYPDGKEETLLSVPNYSFDWQLGYRWADGKKFPKGTKFRTVSHYDNSKFNPFNPDPEVTVREGQQSYHEMNYGFLFYIDEKEDLGVEVDPKTGRPMKSKTD